MLTGEGIKLSAWMMEKMEVVINQGPLSLKQCKKEEREFSSETTVFPVKQVASWLPVMETYSYRQAQAVRSICSFLTHSLLPQVY